MSERKFETEEFATFEQGDFSGEGLFTFFDVMFALSTGTYQNS